MVSFKRKPVKYLPLPSFHDEDTEVLVLRRTGEIFLTYEGYLDRLSFYNQRKFTCDITGHSNLTFFDALDSEQELARDVEESFPEALREPVLRQAQHKTTPRIDDLVSDIYVYLKNNHFPGETIIFETVEKDKLQGIIREKMEIRKPEFVFLRYIVTVPETEEDFVANPECIWRDRKNFTKQMLRQFLRKTVSREAWSGAPWIVNTQLARLYKLETEVPYEKRYDAHQANKKANAALKKQRQRNADGTNGTSSGFPQQPYPDQNQTRHYHQNHITPEYRQYQYFDSTSANRNLGWDVAQNAMSRKAMDIAVPRRPYILPHYEGLQILRNRLSMPGDIAQDETQLPAYIQFNSHTSSTPHILHPRVVPFVKDKTVEDLDLPPNGKGLRRPRLKFFPGNALAAVKPEEAESDLKASKILMKSVGPLLRIWSTLNVHTGSEGMFPLDSFTFDDFVEAMIVTSLEVECELFAEIHCAVLKQLIDDDGDFDVLGFIESEADDGNETSQSVSSASVTPIPDPATAPPARSTRSSLAKSEAAALQQRSSSPSSPQNRASEMLEGHLWSERLKERHFADGGWQMIMVGFLRKVLLNGPSVADRSKCEKILAHLSPIDADASQETARVQYANMDVNMRVDALEIACVYACMTRKFKRYLEECSRAMTKTRNRRTELQRSRKLMIDKLAQLDNQRKAAAADMAELSKGLNNSNSINEKEQAEERNKSQHDVQADHLNGRESRKRKRISEGDKAMRGKKKSKSKEELEKDRLTSQLEIFNKQIEAAKDEMKEVEDHIAEEDADLREGNCARTICLGKDKYCNRYYWFERNGMPYAGLPDSSTAQYEYANGRLWVQGPDQIDYNSMINLREPELSQERQRFGMTPIERKAEDEGTTSLNNADEWGFYDEAADLDNLIAYLNENGVREKALKTQLRSLQKEMTIRMEKLKARYANDEKPSDIDQEERTIRMSTRNKKMRRAESKSYSCQSWTNSLALEMFGHLHSEPPRSRKSKKVSRIQPKLLQK